MAIRMVYVLLFSGFCFLSCKKDREVADYVGDYEIQGQVLDEITGKPIPYAWVGVLARKHGQTSYLGTKSVIAVPADAEGNFHLKFYADATENYYDLSAESLSYFDKSPGDPISFTKNGSRNQNVKLLPEVYLICKIRGNKGGYRLGLNIMGGGNNLYKGADTSIIYPQAPNRNIQIVYTVFFADTSLNYKVIKELPPPPPHDTTYYLIEF